MIVLLNKEIKDKLFNELKYCKDDLILVSAFCKESVLCEIDSIINNSVKKKRLLVRFKTIDIINGVTDFSIIDYCLNNNWELYINLDLHAKTYILDKKRCIVGSANLTGRGLNLHPKNNNIELSTIGDLSKEDFDKINNYFDASLKVDNEMKKELEIYFNKIDLKKFDENQNFSWDNFIISKLNPKMFLLVTDDFPSIKQPDPNIFCYDFLDVEYKLSEEELKERFVDSKCYKWLISVISNEPGKFIYFGKLSQCLHNSLLNDPVPYRKEVKDLISNLLGWIKYFAIEDIIIEVPNHSQKISLKI